MLSVREVGRGGTSGLVNSVYGHKVEWRSPQGLCVLSTYLSSLLTVCPFDTSADTSMRIALQSCFEG